MSKYFTIAELCFSAKAKAAKIDNTPPPEVKVKLQTLIDKCLDVVREAWGAPLHVTSGFRCPQLNKAIGGVQTSQHTKGEAADLDTYDNTKNLELFDKIRNSDIEFDQLIDENNGAWVHISYRAGRNRREVLRYDKQTKQYTRL